MTTAIHLESAARRRPCSQCGRLFSLDEVVDMESDGRLCPWCFEDSLINRREKESEQ